MRASLLLPALLIFSLVQAQDPIEISRLQEDFALFRQALEEAHPGLHRYKSRMQIDSLFESARNRLDHAMTRQEFYQSLSPVISAIGCGHTKLHLDENWSNNCFFNTHNVFPWKLFFSGDKAWVTGSHSIGQSTPTGSEILSIDGHPMTEIIRRLQQGLYSDGLNTTFKTIELQKYFSALYANWYAGPDTFEVVLRNQEGVTEQKIASIDHRVMEQEQAALSVLPYQLEFLQGLTARMTISSFWEESKGLSYTKFLKNSFSALQDSGTKYLILDLRDNEGGMDNRGTMLMRYLTNRPFRYYDRLEATTGKKYSFAKQARLPGLYNLRRRLLSRTDSGTYIWKHSRGLKTQKPMRNAYSGQTHMLINGASFSVTAEFAAVAHHLGRAVFIGEETGGGYNGNNSGSFVIVTLPNSRLNIGIPMLAYYTAVPESPWPGHGVMPDYTIVREVADITSGHDPVMDFVLNLTAFRPDEPDTVPVVFRTTLGDIYADLYIKQAPVTCLNFLHYIDHLGKAGGSFYRTVTPENQPDKKVKIEVIQGGFNLAGVDTAALVPIPLERTRLTGTSHTDGTLSMARSDPDSGSTEFFICIGDQPSLDFGGKRNPDGQGFAAFGRVTHGMDIVRRIQQSPRQDQGLTPEVRILLIERVSSR